MQATNILGDTNAMNIRDQFLNTYMVHLKGALPHQLCDDWVQEYFARTGVDEADPAIFHLEVVGLQSAPKPYQLRRLRR